MPGGERTMETPPSTLGYSRASPRATLSMAAWAPCMVTPGSRRPIAQPCRLLRSFIHSPDIAKLRVPVTVSDAVHRMTAAVDVVRGMQHAAPEGLNAQHIEIISADCVTPQTSILSAAPAHVHGVEEVHRQATEHRVAVPIVFVVGIGNHRAPAGGGVVVEEDEFALILDSEEPEDDGVHHGEEI